MMLKKIILDKFNAYHSGDQIIREKNVSDHEANQNDPYLILLSDTESDNELKED